MNKSLSFFLNVKPVNYAKLDYRYKQHLKRYKKRAEKDGLICQDCGGAGGEVDVILDDGTGPFMTCEWCEGTGYMTKHRRGFCLRFKKQEKQERKKQYAI